MRSRSPVAEAELRAPALERAQALRVREQHALGATGRSRREHDVGDVVTARSRRSVRSRSSSSTASPPARNVGERLGVRASRHPTACTMRHDAASVGVGLREQLDVVDAEEAVDGEQQAGAALPQHVRGFVALEAGVDRYQPRAGAEDAERGDDELERCSGPRSRRGRRVRCPRPSPRASRALPARRAPRRSCRRSPSTTASRSAKRARVRCGGSPGIDRYRSSALTSCSGERGDDRRDRVEVLRVEPGVELDVAEPVLAS